MSSAKFNPCPKCRHQNRQESSVLAGTMLCAECGYAFSSDSEATRSQPKERNLDSLNIIPVRCCQCQKKFGVKARAVGKEVACPHCKTRQIANSGDRKNRQSDISAPAGRPDAAKQAFEIAPMGARYVGMDSISPDGLELLPPKYLVPTSLELTTSGMVKSRQSEDHQNIKKTGIEIDTNVLRLPTGHGAAQIKPMTRELRDRRKRIRVAVVYLFGVLVLIIVFWWLMGRIDPETP